MNSTLLLTLFAFADPFSFRIPAENGGGAGLSFAGSPRAKYDCSVCHDADERLSLQIKPIGEDFFTDGYQPGASYELEVVLPGEPRAAGLVVEMSDRGSQAVGTFSKATLPADAAYLCSRGEDPVELLNANTTVQTRACRAGLNRWRFTWRAPDADAGPVTLYLSAVLGDGNGTNAGDLSVSRVLGVPPRATLSQRATGCGAGTLAMLWVVGLLVFAAWCVPLQRRWRPATLSLIALAWSTSVRAQGAGDAEEPGPPALLATANAGVGMRSVSQFSASFSSPLRVGFAFPLAGVQLRLFPARLMRSQTLSMFELSGSYQIGWALGGLPLGVAAALPADARFCAGLRWEGDWLSFAVRAAYRVEVGGVEQNVLFADAFYQSIGAELGLEVHWKAFRLTLAPTGGFLLDTGTASAKAYGKAAGGWTAGGLAALGWHFKDAGVSLQASYAGSFTVAQFEGFGERDLGPLAVNDWVHAVHFGVTVER